MTEPVNNVLTASRINTFVRCPRMHYWQCEVGLTKDSTGLALRFGSAWARATEARWNGADFETALAAALPDGVDLDALACEIVSALLLAYYRYYGTCQEVKQMYAEAQFSYALAGSRTFSVAGKLDGLGQALDDTLIIIESKTTGQSIAADSDYWQRLRFNMQVLQYKLAARQSGWEVDKVIYDVTRKPSIRPKLVDEVDEQGRNIVLDSDGKRVFLQAGKSKGEPRQTGDTAKGYTLQQHLETPEEFGARLLADATARPDFYFARHEVPILEDDLKAFEIQRLVISRTILHLRRASTITPRPEDGWPRAVSQDNCKFCPYQSFCLNNISVDLNHIPEGFSLKSSFSPELEYEHTTAEK